MAGSVSISDTLFEDVLSFLSQKAEKSYPNSVLSNQIKKKFGVAISPKYFSVLRERSRTERVTVEEANRLSSKFKNAVKPVEHDDDGLSSRKKKAEKSFTPRRAKKFTAGEFYFVPTIGLSQCRGEDVEFVFNKELAVVSFVPVTTSSLFSKRSIPLSELAHVHIREVATEDEMKALFLRIKHGDMCRKLPTKKVGDSTDSYIKVWKGLISGGDLDDYADMVIHLVNEKKGQYGPTQTEINSANTAMRCLADEYAIVMGCTLHQSLDLLKEISGYKKVTEPKVKAAVGASPHVSP